MKLSVMGLGYVGAVSAACLAQQGHEVIGVDPDTRKVDLINAGKTPIIEKEIGQIIERQVSAGRLSATTAVHDSFNPPKTIIGELNRASGDLLASLYTGFQAPCIRTDIATAEMVKYADNAWHALKVGFANEIGNICKGLGVDSHHVMDIFCKDTKLNLSPNYLKPGFAFGGSCLPKDLRALLYKAKTLDVSLPILSAILPSNEQQIERGVQSVIEQGRSEEHTSELQSLRHLVCRLLLEKKKKK